MTKCYDLLIAVKVKDTIAAHTRRLDTADLPLIRNIDMEDKGMGIIKVENTVQAKITLPLL